MKHTGLSCEAILDVHAGTVTLIHSGVAAKKHKKDASPRTIPLGAIESVEHVKKTFAKRGSVRILLRERSGYHPDVIEDVNGYLEKGESGDKFVDAIRVAMLNASAVDGFGAAGTVDETTPGMLERTQNRTAAAEQAKANRFRSLSLCDGYLTQNSQSWPVQDAKASIESAGIAGSRVSATRLVGGAILGGGAGALIGAVARKDQSSIFLTIEFSDGTILVEEFPASDEGDGRRFAARINSIARSAVAVAEVAVTPTPIPAPQGPPAGWYLDPEGSGQQRWWDETGWTEHRQG